MSLDWFEFHPKAFLTDTMRLNTEAKGAYLLLILDYYEKEGPAPDDDDVLAAISGLSLETWRRHRKVIEPLFAVANGLWRHTTCETVIIDRRERAAKKSAEQREKANKRWNKSRGIAAGTTAAMPPASSGHATGNAVAEADFGPSTPETSRRDTDGNAAGMPTASKMPTAMPPASPGHTDGNAGAMHSNSNTIREGANAPSTGEGLIGGLLPSDWTPAGEAINLAKSEGVSLDELSEWLDDWKGRCIDAGTRTPNWHAAWDREYDRRMKLRAKAKPKPRVSVSKAPKKQRLTKIPDDWKPNESHFAIIADRLKEEGRELDINRCIHSFADYIENKRPDWSSADASFRQWLRSPHRTEFTNGKAQPQRRAPAPGGSILDAAARLDARIVAATGGTLAEDQPHGDEAILGLSEE